MTEQATQPKPPIAAAIIVDEGQVLLVRRRVAEGSLSWQFPAGAVEDGETPGQAAVREAREETGLTVAESQILGERVHPATGRTMFYVACNFVEGKAEVADADELDSITWSTKTELTEYVPNGFFPAVQEHLESTLSE